MLLIMLCLGNCSFDMFSLLLSGKMVGGWYIGTKNMIESTYRSHQSCAEALQVIGNKLSTPTCLFPSYYILCRDMC
jgi:hypothetical protein